MSRVRDRGCERAKAWASLELDDELSQLERALLAAHLRRCEPCAAYVADVRAATAALRSAPLEQPEGTVLPPAERASRRTALAARIALAATLAALAGGLGVLAGSIGREGPPAPTVDSEIALRPSADERQDQRRVRVPSEPLDDDRRVPPPGRLGGV